MQRNELAKVLFNIDHPVLCVSDYPVEMYQRDYIDKADRVLAYLKENGWKSPLECNKCINEGAQRVSDAIQQAREEERKEIADYLYEYSTAASAPNQWELIAITLTKEEWENLNLVILSRGNRWN